MVEWNQEKKEWYGNKNLIQFLLHHLHQELNHHQLQLKERKRQLVPTTYLTKSIHQTKSHPVSQHQPITPLFLITKSRSKMINGLFNVSNATLSLVTWKTSIYTWTIIGRKTNAVQFADFSSIARGSISSSIWKSTPERSHLCVIFATALSVKRHIWWSM